MRYDISKAARLYFSNGFSYPQAIQRVAQDIIIRKIFDSPLKDHIIFKGGLVMFARSQSKRRTTMDIDIGFRHFPLENREIISLFETLGETTDGIKIVSDSPIEDLHHEDYQGKRVRLKLNDSYGFVIKGVKIDIGVETKRGMDPIETVFLVDHGKEEIVLLADGNEQIFAEKAISLLRHGIFTTRYKDFFDLDFLASTPAFSKKLAKSLIRGLSKFFANRSDQEIQARIAAIIGNGRFKENVMNGRANWLQVDYEDAARTILAVFK